MATNLETVQLPMGQSVYRPYYEFLKTTQQENIVMHFPKSEELRLKDDPMAIMRKCLKLYGFDGKRKYFWITSAVVKALFLVDRVSYICVLSNQLRRVAELSATLPIATTGLLKMVYLYFDKKRVDYMYDTIITEFWDYRICGSKVEKQAMSTFTFANRILGVHFVLSTICLILFLVFPVADMPKETDRVLPNVIWTPFDYNPSPVHEIVFLILLTSGILTYVGNFMLLKELLRNITEGIMDDASDDDKYNSKYFQEAIMSRLRICAEHHFRLLRFGKNIENFSSLVLIPQLILTYASLVVTGFMLSIDRSSTYKTVMLFNLSITTLIELILFALPSTRLNEQSLTVLDALYDSKWYLFNAPMKRASTFIMMNGREGICIRAGGITKIDNPLLVDILQKVFSAITLLRALVEV